MILWHRFGSDKAVFRYATRVENTRLPETAKYSTDRYAVYNWLPPDRYVARKGQEANRN